MPEIKLYLYKGEADFNGEVMTEDRYIVVDPKGYDLTGEHYTKKTALQVSRYHEFKEQ
jgi:hypothetical protein